jgi:hypothetical protein
VREDGGGEVDEDRKVVRGDNSNEGYEGRRGTATNLVLDRILHNQLDNLNRPLLTQSMNPIHSLIFNRWIPP